MAAGRALTHSLMTRTLQENPTPLPYLQHSDPFTFDLELFVDIKTPTGTVKTVTHSNFKCVPLVARVGGGPAIRCVGTPARLVHSHCLLAGKGQCSHTHPHTRTHTHARTHL